MFYRILIITIIFFFILLFPLVSFGDMIIPFVPPGDVPSPWPRPEPEPESILSQILQSFLFFCIAFIVNGFLLSIGYLILKRRKLIKSWRFLKYILLITIVGALIDLIYVGGRYLTRFKGPLYPNMRLMGFVALVSAVLTFLALAFYNYWLSKKVFHLTKKEAIFIGMLMGIFANPALYSFLVT